MLDPHDLAEVEVLKVGSALQSREVAEQIDRLFATGEFDDIRADAEMTTDGVTVVFVTTPVRYLAAVTVRGRITDPPNRGELAKVPALIPGNAFRDEDLKAAVESMQQLLTANGYYEAAIRTEVEADRTDRQAFLRFRVRPRKRARYDTPVIQGDTKLSTSTIIKATGWRIRFINWWRGVTEARTRNGLQGIANKYQKEDRLKAKIELEDLTYDSRRGRVRPKLSLDAGPKVEVVATEAKVSRGVLKRYVPVFQERTVDNDLLAEGARNLRDYFQSKGYFDAAVDFRVISPQPDVERIEYAISRGPKYKLVNVTITGNQYFDSETLRERMFLEPASFFLRRGRYSEAFRKKDEQSITDLYRANGFRDVNVTSEVTSGYEGKRDHIGVTVHIQEGKQWLVESVEMNGLDEAERLLVEPRLASAPGQPFSEVNIATDRNYLLDHYSTLGYHAADVQGTFAILGPQKVKVSYRVRLGRQLFVRNVLITGLRQTSPKVIEERIGLRAGDPLSAIAQRNSQRLLYDMGVFARVDTAIENPEGATSRKTVLYAFEEAHRYTVSVGFGAQLGRFGKPSNTDLSSAAGSTGFSPLLSLNVSRLNFRGIGHTLSARGVYSSLQKRASISYFAPRFQNIDGRSVTVSVLYDQTRDVRTFASRRQEASVQASQKFSKSTTGLFRIAYRRVSVDDVIIPVLLIPQLLQSVRIGMISANVARDRRDDPADAHRGKTPSIWR